MKNRSRRRKEKEPVLTEEDISWYDETIPNKIVNGIARSIHEDIGWRELEDKIREDGVYGVSFAKKEKKRGLAALYALHQTGAVSLVAVCKSLRGFKKRPRIGSSVTPEGEDCEIYINGRRIGRADEVAGTDIKLDLKKKIMTGGDRKEKKVKKGVWVGKTYVPGKTYDLSYWEGTLNLGNREDAFGEPQSVLYGDGLESFNLSIRNKDLSGIEEVDTKDPDYSGTHDCRVIDKKGKILGFECVNWVKFLTEKEAGDKHLLI